MREKPNKVLFFLVRFSRFLLEENFAVQHSQDTKVYFPASQFFPRPLTAAVITCGPLPSPRGGRGKEKGARLSPVPTQQCEREQQPKSHLSLPSPIPTYDPTAPAPPLPVPCGAGTSGPSLRPFQLGKSAVRPAPFSPQTHRTAARSIAAGRDRPTCSWLAEPAEVLPARVRCEGFSHRGLGHVENRKRERLGMISKPSWMFSMATPFRVPWNILLKKECLLLIFHTFCIFRIQIVTWKLFWLSANFAQRNRSQFKKKVLQLWTPEGISCFILLSFGTFWISG